MAQTIISQTTQFLTFTLANEVFAVDISQVKEVLEYTALTRVPRTPAFMCGVINLRGSVVPVMDMRLKFGMAKGERTVNTCIIILEVAQETSTTVIGAMVDSVKEVMELNPEQIEAPPKIGTHLRTDFIMGMGKQDDYFVIILDSNKIFSSEELNTLQEADNEAAA